MRCSVRPVPPMPFAAPGERCSGAGGGGVTPGVTHGTDVNARRQANVPYHKHPVPHEVDMLAWVGAWPNVEENHVTPVLLEWFRVDQDVLLVLQRPGTYMDLIDHLNTVAHCISEKRVNSMFRQLVDVTVHMMSCGVFHRDVKPGNILLNWDEENNHKPRVRLIDFGCAVPTDPCRVYKSIQGTVLYMAPEWFRTGEYQAYPFTVWQLGMALYVMLHGERPFDWENEITSTCRPYIREGLSDKCKDLLSKLMEKDPDAWISMDEIKEHRNPWMCCV